MGFVVTISTSIVPVILTAQTSNEVWGETGGVLAGEVPCVDSVSG